MPVPSLSILRDLTWKLLQRGLRVGPGFLGQQAVRGGVTGRIFRTFSYLNADWRTALYTLKDSTSLSTADEDGIRAWGEDLGIPQLPGETFDQWGARIRNQTKAETSTLGAVETALWDAFQMRAEIHEPWELQAEVSLNAARSGTHKTTNRYYTGGTLEVVTWQYQPRIYPIVKNIKAGGVKPHYTVRLEGVYPMPMGWAGATAYDRAKAFYQAEAFVALGKPTAWGTTDTVPSPEPTALTEPAAAHVAFRKYYVEELTIDQYYADAARTTLRYPNQQGCRLASVTIRQPDLTPVSPPNPDKVRYFKVVEPQDADTVQPTMVWFEAAFEGDTFAPKSFRQAVIGSGSPRKAGVGAGKVWLADTEVDLSATTAFKLLNLSPVYRYGVQTEVFSQVLDFS